MRVYFFLHRCLSQAAGFGNARRRPLRCCQQLSAASRAGKCGHSDALAHCLVDSRIPYVQRHFLLEARPPHTAKAAKLTPNRMLSPFSGTHPCS